MRLPDVLVVGGGPAGLLVRQLAERHGLDALVLEAREGARSAQSAHVHFFPAGCVETMEAWAPGLTEALRREGGLFVDEDGKASTRSDARPVPTRGLLDRALEAVCGNRGVIRSKSVGYRRNGSVWKVSCADGRAFESRWLIDASGRSRRTLRAIAPLLEEVPVLHEGPAASHYLSARVGSLGISGDEVTFRSRGSKESPGVLGVRLDADSWQITFQLPAGSRRRDWDAVIGLLDDHQRRLFDGHERLSAPSAYGGQRSSCLEIGCEKVPTGWLAVGDALLCTPPYQGNGYANLLGQLELLDQGLRAGDGLPTIRNELFRQAGTAWLQASLLDSLWSPLLFGSGSAPSGVSQRDPHLGAQA